MDSKKLIQGGLKDALILAMAAMLLLDLVVPALVISQSSPGTKTDTFSLEVVSPASSGTGDPSAIPGPRIGHEFDVSLFDDSSPTGNLLATSRKSGIQKSGILAFEFLPTVGRTSFLRVSRQSSSVSLPAIHMVVHFRSLDADQLDEATYIANCKDFSIVLFPTRDQVQALDDITAKQPDPSRPWFKIQLPTCHIAESEVTQILFPAETESPNSP